MFRLTSKKFKKASSALLSMVKDGVSIDTKSQALQVLSQAIFSKPYEEVKETIFREDENIISDFYMEGLGKYLVFKGKKLVFCHDQNPRHLEQPQLLTCNEDGIKSLFDAVTRTKNEYGIDVTASVFPQIYYLKSTDESWDRSSDDNCKPEFKIADIINSAKLFGFFYSDSKPSLLNALSDAELFKINGYVSIGGVDSSEYLDEAINEYGYGENTICWSPRGFIGQYEPMIEFNFTLRDIAEARFNSESGTWFITPNECSSEQTYEIAIYRK